MCTIDLNLFLKRNMYVVIVNVNVNILLKRMRYRASDTQLSKHQFVLISVTLSKESPGVGCTNLV